jgi:hypothetical protein
MWGTPLSLGTKQKSKVQPHAAFGIDDECRSKCERCDLLDGLPQPCSANLQANGLGLHLAVEKRAYHQWLHGTNRLSATGDPSQLLGIAAIAPV